MALRLLVDEDIQARLLVRMLREAGHDVLTVNEAGVQGKADAEVLLAAIRADRVLLTRNPADFLSLSEAIADHPGILAVYQHRDHTRNLSYRDIVAAMANLESTEPELPGSFFALNAYHW